jgi:nuclear transport factor 2 (NTF2) superfamily protein
MTEFIIIHHTERLTSINDVEVYTENGIAAFTSYEWQDDEGQWHHKDGYEMAEETAIREGLKDYKIIRIC